MAEVETLTGINAHTLRAWERRYSFLRPLRTDTNFRFYTDEQLKKLLNIGILIKHGHRISQIDKMRDDDIHELVTEILSTHSKENQGLINGLVLSMLELDEAAFDHIYQSHVRRRGLLLTITELIYPFLTRVGCLWMTNKTMPAQEHFISNLIRQKIIYAIEMLPPPPDLASKIVMFLLEGEAHEIGLLLAWFIAKDLGCKVYYLGQNVPLENIQSVLELIDKDLMLTLFVTPRSNNVVDLIKPLMKNSNVPLLVSGNPDFFQNPILLEGVEHLVEPSDLITFLENFSRKLPGG